LAERGIEPGEIDAVVVGTVTPDMMYPSTACLVQHKLGIPKTWGFDLSAGCSGFVYALTTGAHMIMAGTHKKVLVIGADANSIMVDYTDRAVCVIFGDGAGAVILEPSEDDRGIIDFYHEVDGSGGAFLYMPGGGSLHPATHETVDQKMHYIHQDGQQVFKFAVRKMTEVCDIVMKRNGITVDDLACFIPHQANKRIICATADRFKMPSDKVIINIDQYGNTTAGTIPLGMETARQQGKLKKGDLLLIASVGAGFTSGATLMRW
jgi:3-oxoacyl-[acyl-carrier-protein] synthase-3